MKTVFILITSTFLFAACGGDSVENNPTTTSAKVQQIQASGSTVGDSSMLKKFMNGEKICDVISTSDIQQLFQTTATVEASGFSHRSRYSCTYTWDKPDKAAREQLMMDNMMQAAQGKAERLPMRLKMPTNQITVTLTESKRSAANFMPAKLTEKQLAERIQMAKDAANKKLSKEQKELAGDLANSMVENLMKQNNQNVKVDGIGDAAFWTAVGSGGLSVLLGQVEIYVGPMVADTADEDIENAKNIAQILLK